MKFYLSNLKVNGCKNIDKEIELKFCNSTIKKHVNFSKSNIKAIYGPNGSGKSAIVAAMYIYKRLLCDENGLNDTYLSSYVKEIINKETNKLEIDLSFLVYKNNDNIFIGAFKHFIRFIIKNDNVVIDEERVSKLSGNSLADEKFIELIRIKESNIEYLLSKKEIKDSELYYKSLNTLDKKSIVSSVNKLDFKNDKSIEKSLLSLIYINCFAFDLLIYIEKEDLHTDFILEKEYLNKMNYLNNDNCTSFINFDNELLFDLSVVDKDKVNKSSFKRYEKNINKLFKFIKIFKPNLDLIKIEKKVAGEYYYCNKIFCYGSSEIDIEFESTGLKKLVRTFNALLGCSNGKIVFIDEFDANLHDVYFAKLVEFLKLYAKGQLCFTTHNLEPIDVLKDNSYSLDFLSNDSRISSWTKNGNKSPIKMYINGLIDYSPFNVDAVDFISSLIEEEN